MLNIFSVKKHLDKKTRQKGRIKKIYFPKGGFNSVSLAHVEWIENGLYSLYFVWEIDSILHSTELLSCEKPFIVSKSRIIFGWLVVKFSSPGELGVGYNFYNIKDIYPDLTKNAAENKNLAANQSLCLPD